MDKVQEATRSLESTIVKSRQLLKDSTMYSVASLQGAEGKRRGKKVKEHMEWFFCIAGILERSLEERTTYALLTGHVHPDVAGSYEQYLECTKHSIIQGLTMSGSVFGVPRLLRKILVFRATFRLMKAASKELETANTAAQLFPRVRKSNPHEYFVGTIVVAGKPSITDFFFDPSSKHTMIDVEYKNDRAYRHQLLTGLSSASSAVVSGSVLSMGGSWRKTADGLQSLEGHCFPTEPLWGTLRDSSIEMSTICISTELCLEGEGAQDPRRDGCTLVLASARHPALITRYINTDPLEGDVPRRLAWNSTVARTRKKSEKHEQAFHANGACTSLIDSMRLSARALSPENVEQAFSALTIEGSSIPPSSSRSGALTQRPQ